MMDGDRHDAAWSRAYAATGVGPGLDEAADTVRLAWPTPLVADWRMIVTPPDAVVVPHGLPSDGSWRNAPVPGTVHSALQDAHAPDGSAPRALHDHDVWYRTSFHGHAGERLRFGGLAGLAEIWIGPDRVCSAANMFVAHTVTLPRDGEIVLAIRFRSLSVALQVPSGRSRWRTRLVTSNNLRMQRQTLLGHMPGWCPDLHAIGPYRPIERIRGAGTVASCQMSASMHGSDGVLSVRIAFAVDPGTPTGMRVRVGRHVAALHREPSGIFAAEMVLPGIERWWPHTHGAPTLHEVVLLGEADELQLGRVGFRDIRIVRGDDNNGFGLEINGIAVFCRGACWTSADLSGLGSERNTYATWLELAREAGMNMIRVGGTMLYESRHFHDLCDELGILVWQDLMFANLDYPTGQPEFRDSVVLEVEQLVQRLGASPSLAVLCGGSEIAQQATFLGLDASRRATEFFEDFLPALVERLKPGLPYVPHSPWGGALPVTVNAGVAHYYGVGAYERPLEDARRAGVRFASECLAFANPPAATSPAAADMDAVPRDRGVSWSFADTRDHYLRELYRVEPARLRAEDPVRYHDLSRAVTADLMEAVFAEWRRPGSSCTGGLVWQLQDLAPGSGWGVIDNHAHPKAAWHGLRRVLAPVQILLSDEGLDGLGLHVLNETAQPVSAVVRLCCLQHGSVAVMTGEHGVTIPARGSLSLSSQTLFDGFFDITRAYRFGPAEHGITIATLCCAESGAIMSDAFHFPLGRALPPDDLGLTAALVPTEAGWVLDIHAARFAQAVHVEAEGYRPDKDWFHLPPATVRRVALRPGTGVDRPPTGIVKALNSRQIASIGTHR